MIEFNDIVKLFTYSSQNAYSIEIEFSVKGYPKYQGCFMGKTNTESKIYWFGLAGDGSKAFDYDDFLDFVTAPVFDGKALKEVWADIELLSIDGCDPEERIKEYYNLL